MTNAIIAHLSSDTYASALNFTARSPSPVLALFRELVESGVEPLVSRFYFRRAGFKRVSLPGLPWASSQPGEKPTDL